MRLLILLTVIAVVIVGLAEANVFSHSLIVDAAEYLRAGARRSNHNKSYGSSRSSKRSKSGKPASKQNRWSSKPKKSKGANFKAKLEKLAKQGQLVYKDVYRRAKVLRSSAFESMLLKATWPSNDPVQPDILGEIIKYSIPAFKYTGTDGEDDPYYMTLHKLWTKMSETDWRTITKSLYILHTIMRDSQYDACVKFSNAVRDMSKTYNPKNPEHKYFAVSTVATQLEESGSAAASYQPFVTAYMQYVIYRSKFLPARFEGIKRMSASSTTEKKALSALKKIQQALTFGLEVQVSDKADANAITGYAAKQLGNDLRELYVLLGEKLKPMLLNANGSTGGYSKYMEAQSIHKTDILLLLQFYQSTGVKIQSYLAHSAKLYSRLRIKIPTDWDKRAGLSTEALTQRIRELTSDSENNTITGGAISNRSSSRTGKRSANKSGLKERLLRRAERPLTPEEVQLNAELISEKGVKTKTLPLQQECRDGVCSMRQYKHTTEEVAHSLSDSALNGTRGGVRDFSTTTALDDDDDEEEEENDDCYDDEEEEECSDDDNSEYDEEEEEEEEEEDILDEEDDTEGVDEEEEEEVLEGQQEGEEDEGEGSEYDDQEEEEDEPDDEYEEEEEE